MARKKLQRETEHYGLGQSGFAAGRIEGDPALGIEARNISYPKGTDDSLLEQGDDERWTGAGGKTWVPPERAWLSDVPEDDIEAEPAPDDPKREPDPERKPSAR
ncbi:MAG: hypothetical protein SFX73_19030 [Kofleriaceae bacterium]|nr:hypothetical protein [Kofleriaceae bacterium]